MSKYTYKDIKAIRYCTPEALKGKKINDIEYNQRLQAGYYHPSYANWSYQVYVINYENRLIEVVCLFGEIIK